MNDRGQFVLFAAAVLVVALVPLAVASLQLGYHADRTTSPVDADRLAGVDRMLARTVHDAAADVPKTHAWARRAAAASSVRESLAPVFQRVNRSQLAAGVAVQVTYNASRARGWAGRRCPDGPDRRFGSCVADGGLVLQSRAGRTHVLAVAVDVLLVSERGQQRQTTVHAVWPAEATGG